MSLPEPVEIARLEERRQAFGVAAIAEESVAVLGGTACSNPGDHWVNVARGVGLDGPVTDAEIEAMIAFFRSRGQRAAVELTPFAHPTLITGLSQRGFVIEEFMTCWVFGLGAGMPEPRGVPGVEVRAIDAGDEAGIAAWTTLLSDGFYEPGSEKHRANQATMRLVAGYPGVVCLGAFEGGRLIGAATLEVVQPTGGDAIAGLFAASVRSDRRRCGIQGALIRDRLARAAGLGASVACIESQPGIPTERNARRSGFVPAYTKVTVVQPGVG